MFCGVFFDDVGFVVAVRPPARLSVTSVLILSDKEEEEEKASDDSSGDKKRETEGGKTSVFPNRNTKKILFPPFFRTARNVPLLRHEIKKRILGS